MKIIIGIIAGIILTLAGTAIASRLQPDIEGAGSDGWIDVGNYTMVKRIYDKDNGKNCWLFYGDHGYGAIAIDCF